MRGGSSGRAASLIEMTAASETRKRAQRRRALSRRACSSSPCLHAEMCQEVWVHAGHHAGTFTQAHLSNSMTPTHQPNARVGEGA